MKNRVFLLIFMALNAITAYCQKLSSASVVFTGNEILTPCDIIPLWLEEGALKNDRDTIVVKDKDDINEIVNVVKSLKLSDRKTLDVRGKITVYYDSPEAQIWVYWSDFAVAVGLNGMVYEMSKQFADMINRILKKHSKDVFFSDNWYRINFPSASAKTSRSVGKNGREAGK